MGPCRLPFFAITERLRDHPEVVIASADQAAAALDGKATEKHALHSEGRMSPGALKNRQ